MKSSLLLMSLLAAGTVTGVIVYPMNAHGQQAAKAEKEKLKGDWILVSNESRGFIAEIFGQVPEPEKLKIASFSDMGIKLKIDGDPPRAAAYQLDPTAAPKTLDLTFEYGKDKKVTIQGVYELDGNQLKVCFDSFGEARPGKFPLRSKDPEKPFGRLSVLGFRRVGADPKQDALDQNKAKCAGNLATLARIMHDHVLELRSYPPAAIYSKDGKPLLSWRVALLERMDEENLLKEFKTDEPWDSAHNKKLIKKMPRIYALPGVETKELGMTFFQVFTGKGTIFESKEGLRFTDQLKGDGPSFMIVEAGEPVPWTKPDDLPYDPRKALPKLGRLSDEGFFAAFTGQGDSVRFIPRSTTEKELRSMILWRVVGEKENQKEKNHKNEAENLFRAMEEGLTRAKTLECDFDVKIDTLSYKGSLLLAEGNKVRLEINEATKGRPMRVLIVSDGTRLSYQDNGMPHAKIEDAPKNLNAKILTWVARPGVFLPQAPLPDVKADDAKDRFRVSGFKLGTKEKVGEREAQRLDYQLAVKGLNDPLSVALWLDVKTGLPVKRIVTEAVAGEKMRVTEIYGKLKLGEKVDARKFDLPK
jgi:uncharacterized protein (TIGR03067 family)